MPAAWQPKRGHDQRKMLCARSMAHRYVVSAERNFSTYCLACTAEEWQTSQHDCACAGRCDHICEMNYNKTQFCATKLHRNESSASSAPGPTVIAKNALMVQNTTRDASVCVCDCVATAVIALGSGSRAGFNYGTLQFSGGGIGHCVSFGCQ